MHMVSMLHCWKRMELCILKLECKICCKMKRQAVGLELGFGDALRKQYKMSQSVICKVTDEPERGMILLG